MLENGVEPMLGDHLVTPWMGYSHHGIYVGNGRVIQYGPFKFSLVRRAVEEVSFELFAEGNPVFVVAHADAPLPIDEVLQRARSRLGERQYRLLSNNCEHFCEWSLHGVARSFQVEMSLAFPRMVGERIQSAILGVVEKGVRAVFRRRAGLKPGAARVPVAVAPPRARDATPPGRSSAPPR